MRTITLMLTAMDMRTTYDHAPRLLYADADASQQNVTTPGKGPPSLALPIDEDPKHRATQKAIASVDLAKVPVPGGTPQRAGTGGVSGEAYLKYLAATKTALLDLIPDEGGGEDAGQDAGAGAGQAPVPAEDDQREDAAGEGPEGEAVMSYEMAMAVAGIAGYTQEGGATPLGMGPPVHF